MQADPMQKGPRTNIVADANIDAWTAHAVAGALSGAIWMAGGGLVFSLATVWLLIAADLPGWLTAVPVLLALAELWLLLRVAIDRRLFEALAAYASRHGAADLAGLDAALMQLGWIAPNRHGRTMADRARGALRLVRICGALAVIQLVLTFLTSILG
ncbi:hypothetical protein [Cupriavidus gilardii]|uniref:hypothetical protein n=1 Tax=Cupriavidus gilardii TaxID=82541 RepID=UPI001EE5A09F|nr:hypothetical protein [Cupriavidus gilardii]MCG5258676.1 hypothetical protein [Cupriavidus gilardii]